MPKADRSFDPDDYAPVAERITLFYLRYPSGQILTELVSRIDGVVTCKASVFRSPDDARPAATGLASEREDDGEINQVACLENTETSAIGRALANLGFTASRHRPSAEEMAKAGRSRARLADARLADRASAGVPEESVPGAPRLVRERPPGVDDALQARADALTDVLALLAAAERRGMRPARAEALRARLSGTAMSRESLERAERWLRRWMEEQQRRRSSAHPAESEVP